MYISYLCTTKSKVFIGLNKKHTEKKRKINGKNSGGEQHKIYTLPGFSIFFFYKEIIISRRSKSEQLSMWRPWDYIYIYIYSDRLSLYLFQFSHTTLYINTKNPENIKNKK